MTATLPVDVQRVFSRFITTELTTIDAKGQPITWPVTPYYSPGAPCIDVTTGLGYPKKADDAARNPYVSLLFSDATGCGLERAPMVLVQGTAEVDDRDLDANRDRYARESAEKLRGNLEKQAPEWMQRFFSWYYTRIYLHVRPERVYVWASADSSSEPELFDSHMEEVRSGHDEEPDVRHDEPVGGGQVWDRRVETLGQLYETAVLSLVSPDGFPFSVRVPVRADRSRRMVRIDAEPVGVPLQPGLACVTAHDHPADFKWQRNFQVRGDLVPVEGGWALVPHKLVGGLEEPPGSAFTRFGSVFPKIRRFRRNAKRELARRGG